MSRNKLTHPIGVHPQLAVILEQVTYPPIWTVGWDFAGGAVDFSGVFFVTTRMVKTLESMISKFFPPKPSVKSQGPFTHTLVSGPISYKPLTLQSISNHP